MIIVGSETLSKSKFGSVHMTNGSGRRKNLRILRIRIRNNGLKCTVPRYSTHSQLSDPQLFPIVRSNVQILKILYGTVHIARFFIYVKLLKNGSKVENLIFFNDNSRKKWREMRKRQNSGKVGKGREKWNLQMEGKRPRGFPFL